MILIAHRGNINGPTPTEENKPEYIISAVEQGFDVEIDVWYEDGKWMLGHDNPQYETTFKFLHDNKEKLWIHCKNYEALQQFVGVKNTKFNCFYHTGEDYVLTGLGFIWAWPGKIGSKHTICVMPEYYNTPEEGFDGICSDYIGKYK